MASFSDAALLKKLTELNPSQQSIQTLSLWLIHHRKHHATVVKMWYKELVKASEKRKITFIYLANDIVQNSRKKGPEYGKSFALFLPRALRYFSTLDNFSVRYKSSLERVIDIWRERGVFEAKQVEEFQKAIEGAETTRTATSTATPAPVIYKEKKKVDERKKVKKEKRKRKTKVETKAKDVVVNNLIESPNTAVGDAPEANEFIKALLALENSASSDAEVREEIVALPPDVSDVSVLIKIHSRAAAEHLSKQVDAAFELTSQYNNRLALELEDRKKVKHMLRNFTHAQNALLLRAKQRLKEYHVKLQKVHQIRHAMRSHLQNLPDLSQLPDLTDGLAPLPSAGDLFKLGA